MKGPRPIAAPAAVAAASAPRAGARSADTRYDFELLRRTRLYAPGRHIEPGYRSGVWAEPVDRLLGARYCFAPESFSSTGCLFRGMPRGFRAALESGGFGPLDGDGELPLFENVAGVTFLSHELRDALTVSGLGDGSPDAALLVVPATVFAAAHAAREAAVLAIGDSGMVFRYPFLARPLRRDELTCVVVGDDAPPVPAAFRGRVLRLRMTSRAEAEAAVSRTLLSAGITPARPVACEAWPRRSR